MRIIIRLLKELLIGTFIIFLSLNLGAIIGLISLRDLLISNFLVFSFMYIYLYISYYIGFYVLLIAIRDFFILSNGTNTFLSKIIFFLPYTIMNHYFFLAYSLNASIHKVGLIALLFGLYLYFKVGLEKEKKASA